VILLASLVLSLLIGLARGGHLANVVQWCPRWGWVAVLALLMQVAAVVLANSGWISQLLLSGAIAALLVFAFANRMLPGFLLLALGIAANALAAVVNAGRVPVSPEALAQAGLGHLAQMPQGTLVEGSKDVILSHARARLWWLGDVIPIPPPLSVVLSIGDLAVAAGCAWYWQKALFARATVKV